MPVRGVVWRGLAWFGVVLGQARGAFPAALQLCISALSRPSVSTCSNRGIPFGHLASCIFLLTYHRGTCYLDTTFPFHFLLFYLRLDPIFDHHRSSIEA